jgi:hypothetical protein
MNDEMSKFDYLYNTKESAAMATADASSSDDEKEDEENAAELHKKLGIEPDDVHDEMKIVLQRQFFEAIVRAAYVKYQNEPGTLDQKLQKLFDQHLVPMVGKNKAKSVEDDVSLKSSHFLIEKLQNCPERV